MVSLCMSLLGQFVYEISLKNVFDVKLIYVTTFIHSLYKHLHRFRLASELWVCLLVLHVQFYV